MSFYVTKMSGEKELFKPEKLRRSLEKAGAPTNVIDQILEQVQNSPTLRTTKEIYLFAYEYLKKHKPALGARYSLKQALLELGPAGYSFEQYIAHLFRKQGYEVQTNQIISGHCVDHEIDLICSNKHEKYLIECKFHGKQELKSDVKVSLYVKARFDDIKEAKTAPQFSQAWIVTNTRFTSHAIKFALCRNIQLLGWDYPDGAALPDLVGKYGLHPITALTSLSGSQKKMLIENHITLCAEVAQQKDMLRGLGFSQQEVDAIIKESNEVCEF
jgi:hypothetical protein